MKTIQKLENKILNLLVPFSIILTVIAAVVWSAIIFFNLIDLSPDILFIFWQIFHSYILPAIILISSVLVVILSNPIYALICLIIVFFSVALFLLSINVHFLAMIYLIIYIGAIAILFLFVIMMFNLQQLQKQSTQINDYSFLTRSFAISFLILSKFYNVLLNAIFTFVEYDKYFTQFSKIKSTSLNHFLTYQYTDTLLFGTLLYEYYTYLFLLSGLILLTSMLGAIILALSTNTTRQDTQDLKLQELQDLQPFNYEKTWRQ